MSMPFSCLWSDASIGCPKGNISEEKKMSLIDSSDP